MAPEIAERSRRGDPVTTNSASLVTIPTEILLRIFQYVLRSDQTCIDITSTDTDNTCSSQLLRTCLYVQDHGFPFLYSKNGFVAHTHESDKIFLPKLPASALTHIQHLRINGHPPFRPLRALHSLQSIDVVLEYWAGHQGERATISSGNIEEYIVSHLLKFCTGLNYLLPLNRTLQQKARFVVEVYWWDVDRTSPRPRSVKVAAATHKVSSSTLLRESYEVSALLTFRTVHHRPASQQS